LKIKPGDCLTLKLTRKPIYYSGATPSAERKTTKKVVVKREKSLYGGGWIVGSGGGKSYRAFTLSARGDTLYAQRVRYEVDDVQHTRCPRRR